MLQKFFNTHVKKAQTLVVTNTSLSKKNTFTLIVENISSQIESLLPGITYLTTQARNLKQMLSPRPTNQQTSFSGRGDVCSASGHIVNKFRRPAILQLNIEGFTASKMNVLHHLAVQFEALVILLQETHCAFTDKLVIPGFALAGSCLNRIHGLATFVHERLKWTLVDQSPLTSETEWLCVDVDGLKLSTFTNLHLHHCRLPTYQCFHTLSCTRVISTALMWIGATAATALMESALLLGQALMVLSRSMTQRTWPLSTQAAGTLAPTRTWRLLVLVLIVAYLTGVF